MKRIVITGITGKSGRFLLQRMIEEFNDLQEYEFVFTSRKSIDIINTLPFKAELYIGELSDKNFVKEILKGADTLVHIANIRNSIVLTKAALECNVKRLIYVHTTGIYSKYKAAGESYRKIEEVINALIKDKDVELTILRPTMIYGDLNDNNLSVFIKMIDKLPVIPVIDHAKYELQPVWAKDLGYAYYDVMMNPKANRESYVLSGGAAIKLIDMFHVIEKALGKKRTYISIPFWLAFLGAWLIYIFTLGKKDIREKVQRLVEPRAYDHDSASLDFGYHPANFEDGIKDEIYLYKEKRK